VIPRIYHVLFWVGLLVVALILFGLLQSILLPFAAGLVIAYVLAPAVARLERRGIRRTLGSVAVLISFLLAVGLVLVLLVPLIQVQIVQLIAKVPGLVTSLQAQIGNLMDLLQQHLPADEVVKIRDALGSKLGEAVTWLATAVQSVVTSSIAILNIISLVIVTPIVTFFMLRDWTQIVAMVDSCLPRRSLDTLRGLGLVISDTLVGFIHGQALICLILATYYTIALTVAGLDSSLAVGVLIGILAIIPFLGVTTGFALSVGLAAAQYGTWGKVLTVVGIFVFGQLVEANILTPKLVGDRVHLHPVWVIFALFAGGTLSGFVGVLLAVPAAAVIGVLVRFGLSRYRSSGLYDPHQPDGGPTWLP
jgi:predicted PurR-regulated permease PerM